MKEKRGPSTWWNGVERTRRLFACLKYTRNFISLVSYTLHDYGTHGEIYDGKSGREKKNKQINKSTEHSEQHLSPRNIWNDRCRRVAGRKVRQRMSRMQ